MSDPATFETLPFDVASVVHPCELPEIEIEESQAPAPSAGENPGALSTLDQRIKELECLSSSIG